MEQDDSKALISKRTGKKQVAPGKNAFRSSRLDEILQRIEVQGMTITECARDLEMSTTAVTNALDKENIRPGYLKLYKDHKANVLALMQKKILDSVSIEDLEKASLAQKMMGYGILYDKERLELGKSTQNIAFADLTRDVEELDKKCRELDKELGYTTIDVEEADPGDTE